MFSFIVNAEAKKDSIEEAKLQAEVLSKECYAKTVEPVWDSFFL